MNWLEFGVSFIFGLCLSFVFLGFFEGIKTKRKMRRSALIPPSPTPVAIVANTYRDAMEAVAILRLKPTDYIVATENGLNLEGLLIRHVVYVNGYRGGEQVQRAVEMAEAKLGYPIMTAVVSL